MKIKKILAICLTTPALLLLSNFANADSLIPDSSNPSCADIKILSNNGYLQEYYSKNQRWIEGNNGSNYSIKIINNCPYRVLAIVSVDGVNVLNGKTASFDQSGYVVAPGSTSTIKGWRKSLDQVASFYFTYPDDSYASRTDRPNNLGVIGSAFFRENSYEELLANQFNDKADTYSHGKIKSMESSRAAGSSAPAPAAASPSLGTGHGQIRNDKAYNTTFDRESQPFNVTSIRYETGKSLIQKGIINNPSIPNPFPNNFVPDPKPRY